MGFCLHNNAAVAARAAQVAGAKKILIVDWVMSITFVKYSFHCFGTIFSCSGGGIVQYHIYFVVNFKLISLINLTGCSPWKWHTRNI